MSSTPTGVTGDTRAQRDAFERAQAELKCAPAEVEQLRRDLSELRAQHRDQVTALEQATAEWREVSARFNAAVGLEKPPTRAFVDVTFPPEPEANWPSLESPDEAHAASAGVARVMRAWRSAVVAARESLTAIENEVNRVRGEAAHVRSALSRVSVRPPTVSHASPRRRVPVAAMVLLVLLSIFGMLFLAVETRSLAPLIAAALLGSFGRRAWRTRRDDHDHD